MPETNSMPAPGYMHAIEGRLRVKVPVVRRCSATAERIEHDLRELPGIHYVKANPTTGNILLLFDPERLRHNQIMLRLFELNAFNETRQRTHSRRQLGRRVAETLLQSALQAALERLILTFV